MTPKEKAKDLVTKLYNEIDDIVYTVYLETVKAQAIICVDEIINVEIDIMSSRISYWRQVKRHINSL